MPPHSRLCVAQSLGLDALFDLIAGLILGIRIPRFHRPRLCGKAASQILGHPYFSHYDSPGAERIGHLGRSAFEGVGAKYHAAAPSAIRAVRECCGGLSPLDRLRAELDELWPGGASLLSLDGQRCFVGLARSFDGAEALPHNDILQRDVAPHARRIPRGFQLAANVYLAMSPEGGELELWDRTLSEAEYELLRLPESYGLDRSKLPSPTLAIKPRVGDLILFDSTKPHAVREARGGARVAISCFVVGNHQKRPLGLVS